MAVLESLLQNSNSLHRPSLSIVRWTVRAGIFKGSLGLRKTNFRFITFVRRDAEASVVVDIIAQYPLQKN